MNRLIILMLSSVVVLAWGCEAPRVPLELGDPTLTDDDDAGDDDDSTEDATPAAPPGHLRGLVRTPSGGFVPEASVRVGDTTATTDARGWFEILDLPVGSHLVRATRAGWSTNQRLAEITSGRVTQLEFTLLFLDDDNVLEEPVPGPDAVVTSDEGVTVEFQSGTFTTTDDGEPVEGPIVVSITLIDSPAELTAAPGQMLAVDPDDPAAPPIPLESYGMAEIVLTANGAPVTFTGVALLTFPLFPNHGLDDGESLPVWSFDETQNLWVDEGLGVVDGDLFHAEVTHFTWWNADKPIEESTCVQGSLSLPNGDPAVGWTVNTVGLDYGGASFTVTDGAGVFCAPVKKGGTSELSASGSDGVTLWSWDHEVTAGSTSAVCGGTCTDVGDHVLADLTDDLDGDGVTELAGDCDDTDPLISPFAADLSVDGVDDDCDGIDGPDEDGDGAAALAAGGTDCDDEDPAVRPGQIELCNGADDDCDGTVDGVTPAGDPWFRDADEDGAGDPLDVLLACAAPAGYVVTGDDCDDSDALSSPTGVEVCEHPTLGAGVDEDCDGLVDEGETPDGVTFWIDDDQDGVGDDDQPLVACAQPLGAAAVPGDCDDDLAAVFPGAAEVCNGVDDDCDGAADELGAAGQAPFYLDADGDGYGVTATVVMACSQPPGAAVFPDDCDDSDPAINPGAVETCAATTDLNCDGSVQFEDVDGDGTAACEDCNDLNPSINPNAPELCDLVDSDCDGSIVDYYSNLDGDGLPDCVDDDDDGDGDLDATDCAPLDPSSYFGAPEFCDGVDSDCDGSIVDGFDDFDTDGTPDCIDIDDDNDGEADVTDCAPLDPATFPGAVEQCDGIDNNCDGVSDSCGASSADAVLYGPTGGAEAGASVTLGDLGGDGVPDLIVGAPGGAGGVYVLPGPLNGVLTPSGGIVLSGETPGDEAGSSIASGCDVNGDGADDLIVGAWGRGWPGRVGGQSAGGVYIVLGPVPAGGALANAHAIYEGEGAGDWAGWSVACAGDTDGDGMDGVIVGAWRDDEGQLDAGAAHLIEGAIPAGTHSLAAATAKLTGESAFDYAGASVAGAGDLDGDGFDDLLVGAPGRDEAGSQAGAVYVVHGPLTGTVSLSTATAKLLGSGAGEQAGALVRGAGDVNGDGSPDLLVGAWAWPGDNSNTGAAYVLHGPVAGTASLATADSSWTGVSPGDRLGFAGGAAGDVDGDGFDDVLIGAPMMDAGVVDAGAVFVMTGGPTGLSSSLGDALAILPGELSGDQLGTAVGSVGDHDADGLDDVLLAAPASDPGAPAAGTVYVQNGSSLVAP